VFSVANSKPGRWKPSKRSAKRHFAGVLLLLASAVHLAHALTVKLTDEDANANVALHVGDRLRVDLTSAPATGYRWKARKLDASHLEAISDDFRPASNRLDSAGMQIYVWKALSPGHAQLALYYGRPEEGSSPAATMRTISVEVLPGELSVGGPTEGPDLTATYRGTLPCGSCIGVEVDLALFVPRGADLSMALFAQRWRYRGVNGGNQTRASTGRLTVLHGTYADSGISVYVVDGENYRLEKDRLVALDKQMLPIRSPEGAEVSLEKVPDAASGP